MQRGIAALSTIDRRTVIAFLVVLVLLMGGTLFGMWTWWQNRPLPSFMTLQMKSGADVTEQAKQIKANLSEREFLLKVSKEVGLKTEWNLESDEAGAADIKSRLFVTAAGTTISIGVAGKRKEKPVVDEIFSRLEKRVAKIIGMHAPPH